MAVATKHRRKLDVSDLRFPKTRNNYKSPPQNSSVGSLSVPYTILAPEEHTVESADSMKVTLSEEETAARVSELTRVATQHVEQGTLTTEQAVAEVIARSESAAAADWPMVEVLPSPCYVMKLKDSNGCKFFINVCSHEAIRPGTTYIVPTPKESVAVDGSVCVVYDAVLSQDEAATAVVDKSTLDTVRGFKKIVYVQIYKHFCTI